MLQQPAHVHRSRRRLRRLRQRVIRILAVKQRRVAPAPRMHVRVPLAAPQQLRDLRREGHARVRRRQLQHAHEPLGQQPLAAGGDEDLAEGEERVTRRGVVVERGEEQAVCADVGALYDCDGQMAEGEGAAVEGA